MNRNTKRKIDLVIALAANEPTARTDAEVVELAFTLMIRLTGCTGIRNDVRALIVERYDDGHGKFADILAAAS